MLIYKVCYKKRKFSSRNIDNNHLLCQYVQTIEMFGCTVIVIPAICHIVEQDKMCQGI